MGRCGVQPQLREGCIPGGAGGGRARHQWIVGLQTDWSSKGEKSDHRLAAQSPVPAQLSRRNAGPGAGGGGGDAPTGVERPQG